MTDRVTDEERERLLAYRRNRDRIAQTLGAAMIEMVGLLRRSEALIDASLAEEAAATEQLLQRYGIPSGGAARLDLETGQITTEPD